MGLLSMGWHQLGSNAQYYAENGVIVGTAKAGNTDSLLTTLKTYDDFILEFDVKVDPGVNSGMQFRSQSRDGDERAGMDINSRLMVVRVTGAEEFLMKGAGNGCITYRVILGRAPPLICQLGTI